jgi:fucose permease
VLVFLIAALMFLHVGAEGAFGGWIFSYTTALRLAPESLARLLNSTFWGSLMIGRLIAIPLAARWSPERMLLVGLCGMIASLGVMFVFPQIPLAAWIGAIGFGLFVAPMFATCLNFTERRMPITARVTGMIMIGANAGGMTLPWLIGQFFESAGPRVMVIFIGVSALTALAIYGLIRVYARRFPMRGAEAIS